MAQRRIEFNANSLLRLLTHYLQDHELGIPLDAELRHAGVSPYIHRWVMLSVRSDKWGDVPINPTTREPEPLVVRYEGKKTMSWTQDGGSETADAWQHAVAAPKQQG